ncbi:MAG TPA: PEP-CTERM sorting domain-containing protein [Steroidobacteraceae bacterium]|nr:PEP-CTERM sorting domain-containing protein [Steroidobacteraceae bacterium]
MSKRYLGFLACAIASFAQAQSIGPKEPVTFQFNLPDWTLTTDPAAFGSSGVLDITVVNGTSDHSNQVYLLSQIQVMQITAVGGSYTNLWTYRDITTTSPDASYLSTDASGTPTLDLLESTDESAFVMQNKLGAIDLGIIGPNGGDTTLYLALLSNPANNAAYVPSSDGLYTGFEETGEVVNTIYPFPVPEPGALPILGAGLLAVGFVILHRRRRLDGRSAPGHRTDLMDRHDRR